MIIRANKHLNKRPKPLSIVILLSIVFSISFSCERNTYADPLNNIELTDFTKALISLYLRDSIVQGDMHYYNEITLINHSLDTVSYLSLWANDREQYKRDCYESYVGEGVEYRGKTTYSGYSIRVFGAEDSRFFSVSSEAPKQGRCVINCYEYDPLELQLCIDLDNTIYKDRTFFITLDKDISGIDSLVIHYLARDHRP